MNERWKTRYYSKRILAGSRTCKYADEVLTSSVRNFINTVASAPVEFFDKKEEEGEAVMCRALEEYRAKAIAEGIEQGIIKLMKKNYSAVQISDLLELEETYVAEVMAKIS